MRSETVPSGARRVGDDGLHPATPGGRIDLEVGAMPSPFPGMDPFIQAVFTAVYDRAVYGYSLDCRAPIEPPLSEEDAAWAKGILLAAGLPAPPPRDGEA
jgi:hypothetical protein